ncbi:MAG: hydantoinase/oxoprolinase family protein, partial [Actinobacteria bacterium]|nr:hydantoinase/oxoprolinase family protein [Actinomycetota bacterium]
MTISLGIDTGGTYTDAVLFDDANGVIAKAKALTTRHDLALGIAAAVGTVLANAQVPSADIALVSLSTTLATNALVEGRGGRVALVFIGFDAGDEERAGLAEALHGDPLIRIAGGHNPHGDSLALLDMAALEREVAAIAPTVTGFAVTAQFATRNPAHEIAARDFIVAATGLPVTCGHELSAKLDGPRRALTSVLNARLIGLISGLIAAAQGIMAQHQIDAPLMVVRGDGALMSAAVAKTRPIETILSGPAASLIGASYLTHLPDAIISDIGGTTTDVAMLERGVPRLDERGATVGGFRTMVEAVAMTTVGLGGDSEVLIANAGMTAGLHLGPRRVVPI